jgi:mRNA-degrading endonuclease RelE of RelBE toxin-antitoxin system
MKKMKSIAQEPFRYLEHFAGNDLFKLRIGDYRALIDVDIEKKVLIVRVLDKRSRVYRR